MIQVTEAAVKRIRTLMANQGVAGGGLRISVKGGGCSGLSYVYDWASDERDGDQVFESSDGLKIFVDPKSYPFLKGTVLDCDENMLGQSLVFKNPNASTSCGCGSSFSV